MFEFKKGDTLLIVDLQNDFLPGGKLGIDNGDEIIPYINDYLIKAEEANCPKIFSLDWHPENHMSFIENGGDWPVHCVKDTDGARIADKIDIPGDYGVVFKGEDKYKEQYSAFHDTGLSNFIRNNHGKDFSNRLLICGLAFDVCVLETIRDAITYKFDVYVDLKTTKAVTEEGWDKTIDFLMKFDAVTFV